MRLQGLGLKQIFNILLQHSIWKVNRSSLFLESETQPRESSQLVEILRTEILSQISDCQRSSDWPGVYSASSQDHGWFRARDGQCPV